MSFINLNYVSERDDRAFWRTVRDEFILPITRERIEKWSKRLPRKDDFSAFPGNLPHAEDQLYYPVLDGLGLLDKNVARAELAANPKLRAHARKTANNLSKQYKLAATKAMGHREFLEGLS